MNLMDWYAVNIFRICINIFTSICCWFYSIEYFFLIPSSYRIWSIDAEILGIETKVSSKYPYLLLSIHLHRQGAYVTIPRRPRASWSSEPPPTNDVGEPLYDNLGLRTSATGSSVLSLNKLGEVTTPRGVRPGMYSLLRMRKSRSLV